MMECAEVQRNMLGFAEGDLDPSLQAAMNQHMASCMDCAACAIKFREAVRFMQEEKLTSIDGSLFGVVQENIQRTGNVPQRIPKTGLIRSISYAAMLIAAIITGVYIGQEYAFEQSVASDFQTELFYLSQIHIEHQAIIPLSDQSNEP